MFTEAGKIMETVEGVVTRTEKTFDPIRQSVFRRFPITFTLLVTFGVAATFFGTERIIAEIAWINERPYAIFLIGITLLAVTGRLYKKLG